MELNQPGVSPQEFVRRLIPLLRPQHGYDKGVPVSKIDELYRPQFGDSLLEVVNGMIAEGSIIAARPDPKAIGSRTYGMTRPELLASIALEECSANYPILYLPSEPSRAIENKLRELRLKHEAAQKALAGTATVHGGENVISVDFTRK